MSAHPDSVISCLSPSAEQRVGATAIAIQPAAQNGTSGMIA